MKLFGREFSLHHHVTEKFKGGTADLGTSYKGRTVFYTGQYSWTARCNKYQADYEAHPIAKQALLALAGQIVAEGIYVQPVTDVDGKPYPRSQDACSKIEDLNDQIRVKQLLHETGLGMGKYGSSFWELDSDAFNVRAIPYQEALEPREADDNGEVSKWVQLKNGRESASWTTDIVPFHWNRTTWSWPFGTSLLVGLDNEFVTLEQLEDSVKDYSVKQALPYEIYQIGNGQYTPTPTEYETLVKALKNRKLGQSVATQVPSQILQGGTGGSPLRELNDILAFVKENATDGLMMPPLSKLYNSTEASAKVVMSWASSILIKPLQEIIRAQMREYVYKPYLESLGFSVKICPDLLFEPPDAQKKSEMEFWKGMVDAGICPPIVAAREFGWEDEFLKWEKEKQRQQEEQTQLKKIEFQNNQGNKDSNPFQNSQGGNQQNAQ